jgi:hypothetical protein
MTDEKNKKRRGPSQLRRERQAFLHQAPAQRPLKLPEQAVAPLPKTGLPPLPSELSKRLEDSPIPHQAPEIRQLPQGAFHRALRECKKNLAVGTVKPASVAARRDLWAGVKQLRVLGSLARIWSWLQSRSAYSSTKRLRLVETVSLGEKRFVAIVSVENREYLIGGAPSGVSLLAQWGKNGEAEDQRRPALGAGGHSL